MNCRTLKGIRLAASLAVALVLLAVSATGLALAQEPSGATNVTLSVAKTAQFGQTVQLSARLVDAAGAPISGAKVAFVVPDTFFLGVTSDVLIAEVQTNKEGVAEAEYKARDSGWLAVRADFRGSDRYAAARATGRILIDESPGQLYVERVGVQVPGLNAPPTLQPASMESHVGGIVPRSSGLAALWPAFSAWPIALVLLIVWSLYAVAVSQMFQIASASLGEVAPVRVGRDGHQAIAEGHGGGWHPQSIPELRRGLTKFPFVFPIVAAIVVVVAPATLIAAVILGPYTHANLTPYFDLGYTRTEQIEVGPPLLYRTSDLAIPADATASMEERGKALLVARGCATCHGMGGQGGTVAPAIIPDLEVLREYVRRGPSGMPVFAPQDVTDYDLTAIAAYLKSVSK